MLCGGRGRGGAGGVCENSFIIKNDYGIERIGTGNMYVREDGDGMCNVVWGAGRGRGWWSM